MTFLLFATLGGCFGPEVPNPYADSDDWPTDTADSGSGGGTESGDSGDSGDTADTSDTADTAAQGPPAPHSWLQALLGWIHR